jgi:NAD+ synthase (glutamine-hydrolysing)
MEGAMIPKIALAQFDPIPGDISGNVERMARLMEQAAALGARLVVFPEGAVGGYCVGDLNRNAAFVAESLTAVERVLAPASRRIAAVVGLSAPEPSRRLIDGVPGVRNAWIFVEEGRVRAQGAKALLVDDGVFYDSRYFLAADPAGLAPVDSKLAGTRLGVMICHDMWSDHAAVSPSAVLREKGAELLVVLNSSPFSLGKQGQRVAAARARVRETGLPLTYVNTAGIQDNGKNVIIFDGGSFMLDGDGAMAACCPQFEEGLYVVPGTQPPEPDPLSRVEELHAALVFGLGGFFRRTGNRRAVIGLSGGIDSSLGAVLLVQALGRENVLGVNMPTRFSSATTREIAAELARRLGIEYVVHPIEEIVRRKAQDYEDVTGSPLRTLSLENIQARERGNVLMTHAQERGALVIGNGNKTEFQRGYATMYGDIIGALMPLGDVAKTDVYRLAAHVNRAFGDPIPEAALAVAPSAELSEAQDVERGLGDPFDYDVEAPMGQEIIERERRPAELRALFESQRLDPELWEPVRSKVPVYEKMTGEAFEELAKEVVRALEATVFKRIQAPPVLKVSTKAFGFDFRESMLARFRT